MKDMKLSNIQKESEKIKLKKEINEFEDLKAKSLLKLGIMTFDKIRKNEIVNKDFDEICEEIKKFDIEIYTKYMQIYKFEKENSKTTCECGYVAFKNEQFFPQCGKSLIKEEKPSIICPNCSQEIDEDSIFCTCCGNRVSIEKEYNEEVYCEDNELDFYIEKEELEEDFVEKEGREFLKVHQDNNMEQHIKRYKKITRYTFYISLLLYYH